MALLDKLVLCHRETIWRYSWENNICLGSSPCLNSCNEASDDMASILVSTEAVEVGTKTALADIPADRHSSML